MGVQILLKYVLMYFLLLWCGLAISYFISDINNFKRNKLQQGIKLNISDCLYGFFDYWNISNNCSLNPFLFLKEYKENNEYKIIDLFYISIKMIFIILPSFIFELILITISRFVISHIVINIRVIKKLF